MAEKRLVGAQLKSMLTGLSERGIQHLTDVETDLLQTNLLLEEAIAKLVASFMAVNAAISVQQEMMEGLISGQVPAEESAAGMRAISEEIVRHIGDAITGMQFHDMTRQLIERIMKRIIGLRGIMASLGSSGAGMPVDAESERLVAIMRSINRQLALQNAELNEMLWKTVRQKHMDSGDIELF